MTHDAVFMTVRVTEKITDNRRSTDAGRRMKDEGHVGLETRYSILSTPRGSIIAPNFHIEEGWYR